MYLQRIDLQGFKTFPRRTTLEFRPGVTAIVGPNGAGKSNLSDAVRWAMGEQAPRLLRIPPGGGRHFRGLGVSVADGHGRRATHL